MTLATPHRASRPRSRPGVSTTEAVHRLQKLTVRSANGDEVISPTLEIAAELIGALGVVFFPRDETQQLCLSPEYFSSPHLEHLRGLLRHMLRLATVAGTEEAVQAGAIEGEEGIVVVAVPVFGGNHGTEAIAAAIGFDSEAQARTSAAFLQQILTWVSAFLASLRNPQRHGPPVGVADLIAFHDMLAAAASQSSLEESCQFIAEWIRAQKHAPMVAIGVRRGWQQQCQLIASTGGRDFDNRSDTVRCLSEVMEETIIADTISDNQLDASWLHTSAPEQLTRVSGLTVTQRFPLRDIHGSTFAVVFYLSDQAHELCQVQPLAANAIERHGASHRSCEAAFPRNEPAASAEPLATFACKTGGIKLAPAEQASLGRQLGFVRATARHRLWRKLRIGCQRSERHRHPFVWSTLGLAALLMMIPMPLMVKCPCRVQPQQRRFVSVPYEGRLQQALTEPGEVVRAGQLLARMDDRDVTWEISQLKADLRRAEKDRDIALAVFDTSASQMAGLQAERLRLQIAELQGRLRNLEIRSPIAGIVIGGDPRKLEGARLTMGETLLEISPLDKMVVELEIQDEDISHLQRQQAVEYRLNALPWRSFAGTVDLIRPQSELREDANVFVAETEIENSDGHIRPGMRGKARIKTARHPLAWNLFHKPWNNLKTWIAW